MKISIAVLAAFMSAMLSAQVETDVRFESVPVSAIRPIGHLREFLRRQGDSIAGYAEMMRNLDRDFSHANPTNGDVLASISSPPSQCQFEQAFDADRADKKGVWTKWRLDEQADGLFSCNELMSGRDPRLGHETCVTAAVMKMLGCFLEADGDIMAADRMERIAYNALPGGCTKDLRRHQYVSAVNQPVCGPFALSSHFCYGESAWRQFRPSHFPQCSTGDISRVMSSFVRRMWMKDRAEGRPVAMLYGPCEYLGEKDGVPYTIVEKTNYPFEEKVVFELKVEVPMAVAILCRVPRWSTRKDAGRLVPVSLATNRPVVFELPSEYVLESDRNWHWVRRGPLTYSYVPPATTTEETPGDPFSPLRIEATPGTWNYAFDVEEVRAALKTARYRPIAVDYPFETPALRFKVPAHRIREWQVLDEGRFMPDLPLATHLTGESTEIELVPYATTLQRITCFPDTTHRTLLPTVSAYVCDELFAYDESAPLAAQGNPPEHWPVEWFRRNEWRLPRHADSFFDVGAKFSGMDVGGKLCYMVMCVWSDEAAADATWCLAAGYEAQAFIDSEEVYRTDGMTDPTCMTPVWIRHPVKKGYNYMLVKLGRPSLLDARCLPFWGAKLQVFIEKKPAN